MSAASDWFDALPPEKRAELDRIAQESILELPKMPRDLSCFQEILAWQQLENDVLTAHADWLARTKARFERLGIPWTVENLNRRYSRLWEHE
jgi:hypothetical protein